MKFKNAQEAFENIYDLIIKDGVIYSETKCLFNIGFYMLSPEDNIINTSWRKFKPDYAEQEWQWYLSGNKSANKIAEKAKIWYKCMDKYGFVNSNYGAHWYEGNQLDYVINELKQNPQSRRASISIYNAKNRYNFENDTPCTYAINFCIIKNQLCMNVLMRSNDLWYGFANDQYCFSKLQQMIAKELNIKTGWYYHFTNNMHLYFNFLNKNN